jgi:hypothetical protein
MPDGRNEYSASCSTRNERDQASLFGAVVMKRSVMNGLAAEQLFPYDDSRRYASCLPKREAARGLCR